MIIKHRKKISLQLAFLLGFNFLIWFNLSLNSLAQNSNSSSGIKSLSQENSGSTFLSYHKQPKPPDHGTPKTTRGTGSRGNCFYGENSVPLTSLVGNNFLTKTINEYPSIWIYIPFSVAEVSTAEFILQDEENDIHRSTLKLPSNIPGIVQIELPETVAPLKIDKSYRWYFEVQCGSLTHDNHGLPRSEALTGIVHKIIPSPELDYELKTSTTTIESIKALAKHGIWYDSLSQMAQLRLQKPQQADYEKLWKELLSQPNVGLNDISDKRILGTAE